MIIFQTIRSRNEYLYYYKGDFHLNPPDTKSATWAYYPQLFPQSVFTQIICENHPERFVDVREYEKVKELVKLHLKILKKAKIDLLKNDWYKLIPRRVLANYLESKNKVVEQLAQLKITENYEVLLNLLPILAEIEKRKVYEDRVIRYQLFKTKTGRLGLGKNSFPILTLKKEARSILKPKNDFFLSLDYNAFDVRVFMALCEVEQPKEDIHQYHRKSVFGIEDREISKKRFFAWLYNSKAIDEQLEGIYNKNLLLTNYYQKGYVKTPFGKEMASDEHHALPYLIQSTAASVFYEQVVAVYRLLKGRKSEIFCLLHDEILIDFSREDAKILDEVGEAYKKTRYGEFLVRMKVGKDLGNMKVWKK